MDVALPVAVPAGGPPGPAPTSAPEVADAATDAAFAALLATLVAAQAPQVPVVDVPVATPVPTPASAPVGDVPVPAPGTVVAGVVPGPVSETALLLAAAAPAPAPAPAQTASDTPSTASPAENGDLAAVLDTRSASPAAPVDGPVAPADDVTEPVAVRPAVERVTAQPVAPPDSEILLARAVPAVATTVAAVPAVLSTQDEAEPSPVVAPVAGGAVEAKGAAPVEVAKPVAPALAPRAAEQVVRVVAPLRAAADGTYELGLELRPDGLGRVQLDVTVERGVVHLAIRAETAAAGELLHRSLPEMRAGLADAGLQAGRLGVQSDGQGGNGHPMPDRSEADARRAAREHPLLDPADDDRPPVAPAYADARLGGVDLLL